MPEAIKNFHLPKIGLRIVKTLLSVLIICAVYEQFLGGRNPCFACIGAVYGMGRSFTEGYRNGLNRFIGTALGGLLILPFYPLYWNPPFNLPDYLFLLIGLLAVIYVNVLFGAHGAVQPATVVYFVVMFTQIPSNYVGYTLARIVDTGAGVALSLIISHLLPSPHEKTGAAAAENAPAQPPLPPPPAD